MGKARNFMVELAESQEYQALQAAVQEEGEEDVARQTDSLLDRIRSFSNEVCGNIFHSVTGKPVEVMVSDEPLAGITRLVLFHGRYMGAVQKQVKAFMDSVDRQAEEHLPVLYEIAGPSLYRHTKKPLCR